MIDESGKLIIFLLGIFFGYFLKDRKAKGYMIKEFAAIKKG